MRAHVHAPALPPCPALGMPPACPMQVYNYWEEHYRVETYFRGKGQTGPYYIGFRGFIPAPTTSYFANHTWQDGSGKRPNIKPASLVELTSLGDLEYNHMGGWVPERAGCRLAAVLLHSSGVSPETCCNSPQQHHLLRP
jgi:hypothetical protein